MLLFHAVHTGPTYLIFPIIALSPVVTRSSPAPTASPVHLPPAQSGYLETAAKAGSSRLG